jgi:hypothetical protein
MAGPTVSHLTDGRSSGRVAKSVRAGRVSPDGDPSVVERIRLAPRPAGPTPTNWCRCRLQKTCDWGRKHQARLKRKTKGLA